MSFYKKNFRFAAALLITSGLFSASVIAADPAPKETDAKISASAPTLPNLNNMDKATVLATVNGQNITLGDVMDARQQIPQLQQIPLNAILPMMVDQLTKQKAILELANNSKIADTPDVKKQLDAARDSALIDAYITKQIEPKINDATIKQAYDAQFTNQAPQKVAHIRHILVKTKPEAEKIIKELKAGKKFTDLAKQYSIDTASSSHDGGDLGWVKANELVPDFSKAAFAMKANTFSATPVQTPFGWHVIQVLAYKDAPVPTLQQATPAITEKLKRDAVRGLIENTVKQSKITVNEDLIKKLSPQAPAAMTAPSK